MNRELNIQKLVSYLTGNSSVKDEKKVEEWLTMSNENMMLFDDFKQVWDATTVKNDPCLIDIDSTWEDFIRRTNFSETQSIKIADNKKPSNTRVILNYSIRVAAMIVIVFGFYFLINKEKSVDTIMHTAALAQLDSPTVLPDGSNVTMNKGANIDYPERFTSDTRNINFTGEAFFDVVRDPEKPMIIASDNVRVKVLGTSFNLCNYNNSDEITVYLESGKILFYSVDEDDGSIMEQIILYPEQKGIYNKNTGLITKHNFSDRNHLAWKTGALEFVKAPMPDVIQVLEKTYKVEINSQISLLDNLLTARFNDETPESIFESLQIIYGFNYEINDNSIMIY